MQPECRGRKKGADDDAADQHFPQQAGIDRTEIARRRKPVGLTPGSLEWRDGARKGLRSNRDFAACPPTLANHHSPADFSGRLSGFTGLNRVNAVSEHRKMLLKPR